MINFKLDGAYIPLIQLLKATNLVENGAQAQAAVSEGLVKCNGMVELRKRYKVKSGDTINFEGFAIEVE